MHQKQIRAGLVLIAIICLWHISDILIYPVFHLLVSQSREPEIIKNIRYLTLYYGLGFIRLEIILKFITYILSSEKHNFVSANLERLPGINLEKLTASTSILESLGFIQLTDYSILNFENGARLFGHPQRQCFAEIGHVEGTPMYCSIFSRLQDNWVLGTSNVSLGVTANAFHYAFNLQPRYLLKNIKYAPIETIFESHLEWRAQISRQLNAEILSDISAETFFELEQQKKRVGRNLLVFRKSIIWSILKTFWYSLRPPRPEWLGEYPKTVAAYKM